MTKRGTVTGLRLLTKESWTAPQRHVAVARPSLSSPDAPSDGSKILGSLIVAQIVDKADGVSS